MSDPDGAKGQTLEELIERYESGQPARSAMEQAEYDHLAACADEPGGGGGMSLSSPFRDGSGTASSGGRFTRSYCAPACGQPPSHPAGRSCHRIRRNDDRQH